MIRKLWEQILENREIRQSLSNIRKEIKDDEQKTAFLYLTAGSEDVLIRLLKNEDAKSRKNVALLMGELGCKEYLEPLYEAYQVEEQLFVKSFYLTAIRNFDYRKYMPQLTERLEELTKIEMTEENQKHLSEEIRQLSAMKLEMDGIQKHEFRGVNEKYDVILLTNRDHQEITEQELKKEEPYAETKIFGAGVMARVNGLRWVENVRTYQELLFTVRGMKTCKMDPQEAAETIVNSDLMTFLKKGHKGKVPFYFRIEFKSKMELSKRSAFTKKLSSQLEKLSNRELINTTSNYEFEIRLIENKMGNCNLLVKLYTLEDSRFAYRKEVSATSIRPVNAALTVALAKEYMEEGAQVLDPFCGVGTMIIERYKAVQANTTYGIDFNEECIEKAKVNTEAAHQIIHFVNKNFFDFKHEYLFDEIITDMPFCIGRKTEEEIWEVYEQFFPAARNVLKENGIVIMYTHDREHVKAFSVRNKFKLLKEYEISRREGTYVMILKEGTR